MPLSKNANPILADSKDNLNSTQDSAGHSQLIEPGSICMGPKETHPFIRMDGQRWRKGL